MNPSSLPELQQRRDQILDQMRSLDQMRRGSLSRQLFSSPSEPSTRNGPYFVLQGYLRGQKFSKRVPADQAPAVEAQVGNYKRFQELADEFVTVTERLTLQEEPDSKKNSARRSKRSASAKPRPSSV